MKSSCRLIFFLCYVDFFIDDAVFQTPWNTRSWMICKIVFIYFTDIKIVNTTGIFLTIELPGSWSLFAMLVLVNLRLPKI